MPRHGPAGFAWSESPDRDRLYRLGDPQACGDWRVHTANRRDLDYIDVVEVGFVIPLLIR